MRDRAVLAAPSSRGSTSARPRAELVELGVVSVVGAADTKRTFRTALGATILNTAYTSGDREGRTRLEVYADEVDAENVYASITLTPADAAALAVPVAERSYNKTRGVAYDDRYWLSPELAAAAQDKERITLKQRLDPDVLHATAAKMEAAT